MRSTVMRSTVASFGPGRSRHHGLGIVGQARVVVASDPIEEREAPRGDAKARERPDGDRARKLRDVGGPPRVDASRLPDEGVRREEVEVARAPRAQRERLSADREVVVRVAGVLEHEAAVVERQAVSRTVDDRVEHRPDRVARREDRALLTEGREVDRLARLEPLDARLPGPVEGDAPTSGQTAEELPANHPGLSQELVDVHEPNAAVRIYALEKAVD